MLTFSLQSGSNGNSIYVEAGNVRLLFDAGISGRQAEMRLASKGRDIRDCDAVIISHDHSDHTRCAGIFQRKFGLPIYITREAYRRIRHYMGTVSDVRTFEGGDELRFGDVTVQTIPTPHDGMDPVCFVVAHGNKKLGIFTDLGHPFAGLKAALADVDAAYLESNYDPHMLRTGSYPEVLKRRIAGSTGHLSNDEAAELTSSCANGRLKWVAAAHLSQENNQPDIALEAHRRHIGNAFPVHITSRYEVSDVFEV